MASDDRSAAEKFADEMGAAARQLQDAFLKLIELYKEHQEKLQKANAEQQAALKKQFAETLQAEGYAPTDENIALLREHAEKTDVAQKQVNDLQAQLDGMGTEPSTDMKILQHKNERAKLAREEVMKGGPGGIDQAKLKGLDTEIADLDKQIAELDPERHSLSTQLNAAKLKLDGLNKGEGLEGLKEDTAKNVLKTFRKNSTGDKLMQTNSLSESEQFRLGVKLKPSNTEGGPSKTIKLGTPRIAKN